MHALPILIADIGQVIQVALVLLFIVGPLIFRLFGASARQPDRTVPKRRPQRPNPPAQGRPSPVDSEVDAFLRRANAQRGGEEPVAVEVVMPDSMQRPRRPRRMARPVEEVIIEADVMPEEGIQSRIQSSINTSDFDERAERLGDHVEQADDTMEARLRGKFDHSVGNLSTTPTSVVTSDVTPAPEEAAAQQEKVAANARVASLVARLRSPQGMRDAIVLREILERPDQRW